jgi:hypothetical protein
MIREGVTQREESAGSAATPTSSIHRLSTSSSSACFMTVNRGELEVLRSTPITVSRSVKRLETLRQRAVVEPLAEAAPREAPPLASAQPSAAMRPVPGQGDIATGSCPAD